MSNQKRAQSLRTVKEESQPSLEVKLSFLEFLESGENSPGIGDDIDDESMMDNDDDDDESMMDNESLVLDGESEVKVVIEDVDGRKGSADAQGIGRKLSLSNVMRSRSVGQKPKSMTSASDPAVYQTQNSFSKKKKSRAREWFEEENAPKDVIEKMSMKEIRFQAAIYEIYTTECDYIDDLELLFERFYAPLRLSDNSVMKQSQVDEIFGPLKEIIHVNKALLKGLKERRKNIIVEKFADLFIAAADDFKLYSIYCCNYDKALALLQRKMAKEKIANFIKEAESDPRMKKVPLVGHLVKPVQRATRYPLLLKEVLKNCDESHPDYPNIALALQKMQEVASKVDNDMGSAAKIQEITMRIQTSTEEQRASLYKLASPNRKFIKEYSLEATTSLQDKTQIGLYVFSDRTLVVLDQRKVKKKPRLISIWDNSAILLYTNLEGLSSQLAGSHSPLLPPSVSPTPSPGGSPTNSMTKSPTMKRGALPFSESKDSPKEKNAGFSETSFLLTYGEEYFIFEGNEEKAAIVETVTQCGYICSNDPIPKTFFDVMFNTKIPVSTGTIRAIKKSLDRSLSISEAPDDPQAAKSYDVMKSTAEKMSSKEGLKKGEHELVLYTYATAAWCDICGDFIWGFRKQGYKCKFCFLDSHEKCMNSINLPCLKQNDTLQPESHGVKRKSYAGPKQNHGPLHVFKKN